MILNWFSDKIIYPMILKTDSIISGNIGYLLKLLKFTKNKTLI